VVASLSGDLGVQSSAILGVGQCVLRSQALSWHWSSECKRIQLAGQVA
jgi:hypothetical protein